MKKTSIIITMFIALLLSSCSGKTNSSLPNESGSSSGSNTVSSLPDESGSTSDSSSDNNSGNSSGSVTVNHENPRIEYSKDEICDIITEHSNFKVSDNIDVDVPKEIGHVSSFFSGTTPPLSGKEAVENFRSAFEYLFPEHVFDEQCLIFQGPHADDGPSDRRVSDYYDEIMSGSQEVRLLYYDEYNTNKDEKVSLVCQSPFGNTITTINKCVAGRIAYEMGKIEKYGSDVYNPSRDFPCVGKFSPDSDAKFQLLDKEVSIKEAVDFYKKFIYDLPCVIEPTYSINVNNVKVYKIKDDLYYYLFSTSRIYDEIPFDYARNGAIGGRDNRDLGIGGMIKSNDVDYVYGTFKLETVIDEQQFGFEEVIPFEKAVEIVRDKMTSYIDFTVSSAQLVYCMDDDLGTGKLGETKNPVFPAWKIILYNPNDEFFYCCYVNMLNGEFESYKEH